MEQKAVLHGSRAVAPLKHRHRAEADVFVPRRPPRLASRGPIEAQSLDSEPHCLSPVLHGSRAVAPLKPAGARGGALRPARPPRLASRGPIEASAAASGP